MRTALLVLCLVTLCGCAARKPLVFDPPPGATRLDFARARYQCMEETQEAGNYTAFGPPLLVAAAARAAARKQRNFMVACMEARGYIRVQ